MKVNLVSLKKVMCSATVILIFGCSKEDLTPNGQQKSEIRHTASFKRVEVSGASSLFISYASTFEIKITGSDNLIPKFQTLIEGDKLILKYDDVNVRTDDLRIDIVMPRLQGVRTNGSAGIEISGYFPEEDNLSAGINGSGDITFLGSLLAETMVVEISGSGNADLQRVISHKADIRLSGSGDVKATVSDHLKARISGSGHAYYNGNPVLDVSSSGTGKIIKL